MNFARETAPGVWAEILPPCVLHGLPIIALRPDGLGEMIEVEESDDVPIEPGFLEGASADQLAFWKIAAIAETPLPMSPAVTVSGSTIADLAGVPTRSWTTTAIALEDLRARQLVAAEVEYNERRQTPLTWDFGEILARDDDGIGRGPAGLQTLQMRDSPERNDLVNWLSAQVGAMTLIAAGQAEAILPLKVTSNFWVQTTAEQVIAVLVAGAGGQLSALQRGQAMLARFGAIKKALADATNPATVLEVDLTAGYPG